MKKPTRRQESKQPREKAVEEIRETEESVKESAERATIEEVVERDIHRNHQEPAVEAVTEETAISEILVM